MRTYYIYKTTNIINGKSYIGQTVDFNKRRKTHLHDRHPHHDPNSIFHKAIDRYGEDAFEWEIVARGANKEVANILEKAFIEIHDTYKPNGYNLTKGGDGGSMWNAIPFVCLTPDGQFVKRYDSACEAEKDGFYYGGVLKSCRDARSQTKGFIFMFEDEYKEKGGRRKEDRGLPNFVHEIYQCDMDGNLLKKFDSIAMAEKELNIHHSRIVNCAKGRDKSAGGYIFVYPEDFPIKDIESHKKKVKGHRVAKVDMTTGEILARYDRMTDAAKELGGSHKMIFKVLDNPNKTAYGYKWISQ